jgi:hypothetical protein
MALGRRVMQVYSSLFLRIAYIESPISGADSGDRNDTTIVANRITTHANHIVVLESIVIICNLTAS